MNRISFHKPALWPVSARSTAGEKLTALHRAFRKVLPAIDRVAVALYDQKTGAAGTFISSGDRPTPLTQYDADLAHAPSLHRVLRTRRIRLVSDMRVFSAGANLHTRALWDEGFRSSATVPMLDGGCVAGFIFFNSRQRGAFRAKDLPLLEVFAETVAAAALQGERSGRILRAALKTAGAMMRQRDRETGDHLERMARYARLIAQELARDGRAGFNDERVRHIESFAPMHDVGKMAIPDRVLRKRGRLNARERRVMHTHALRGKEIVDDLLRNFGLRGWGHSSALRHIAHHHHEAMDGTGYPDGLRGHRIPIEARIVAVADVFDALTSARPYKDAWTVDRAFRWLTRLSRGKLDRRCVGALLKNRKAIEDIRRRFRAAGRLPLSAERDIPGYR